MSWKDIFVPNMRRRMRALEGRLNVLSPRVGMVERVASGNSLIISDLQDDIIELNARLSTLEGGGNSQPVGWPEMVYNVGTLAHAADAALEGRVGYYDLLTIPCAELRDKLAAHYPNIERVNDQQEHHGYSHPDHHKHADAFVLIINHADRSQDVIIDFCRGSKGPGSLNENLQWSIVGYPVGWRK